MLTRRAVLTGTAAGSIAAIASARGIAAAEPNNETMIAQGFDLGFGDLEDGALGAFYKKPDSFGVFLRWNESAAEVFYKETPSGAVEVFFKTFFKNWTPVTSFFLKELGSLEGAEAAFYKIDSRGAEFFIKGENRIGVVTTFESDREGVQIDVAEVSLDVG
jgi:hypothetical protein